MDRAPGPPVANRESRQLAAIALSRLPRSSGRDGVPGSIAAVRNSGPESLSGSLSQAEIQIDRTPSAAAVCRAENRPWPDPPEHEHEGFRVGRRPTIQAECKGPEKAPSHAEGLVLNVRGVHPSIARVLLIEFTLAVPLANSARNLLQVRSSATVVSNPLSRRRGHGRPWSHRCPLRQVRPATRPWS